MYAPGEYMRQFQFSYPPRNKFFKQPRFRKKNNFLRIFWRVTNTTTYFFVLRPPEIGLHVKCVSITS